MFKNKKLTFGFVGVLLVFSLLLVPGCELMDSAGTEKAIIDETTNPSATQETTATTENIQDKSTIKGTVFLDVGQGNAVLVYGNEYTALVDFGRSGERLSEALRRNSVEHLDYLFITHPDQDHFGGGDILIKEGIVDNNTVLFTPTFYFSDKEISDSYNKFIKDLNDYGVKEYKINTDNVPNVFGETLSGWSILWPNPSASDVIKDKNNNSLVIYLESEKSVLLTGDIENEVESYFYENLIPIDLDVLLAAHHGSEYSAAPAFLEWCNPKTVVISVGSNSYGHPHKNTIRRYEYITRKNAGKEDVRRTDMMGDVRIEF